MYAEEKGPPLRTTSAKDAINQKNKSFVPLQSIRSRPNLRRPPLEVPTQRLEKSTKHSSLCFQPRKKKTGHPTASCNCLALLNKRARHTQYERVCCYLTEAKAAQAAIHAGLRQVFPA